MPLTELERLHAIARWQGEQGSPWPAISLAPFPRSHELMNALVAELITSPAGPHTHLLPKFVVPGRTRPRGSPPPEGLFCGLSLYPRPIKRP